MITIVGPIPAEYRHAEWGEEFPPFYITDRMRDGRYKGAIYDPGPLYNWWEIHRRFEEIRG